ncbi:hypothetical protein [Duganella qianjiadongensis]|uniref:DUF1640 domain-containing protein n=1 Tax=Duganella qianjiadongensis TaxID=2692176 RepID=A0ABW9VMW1_9BURK|nr:hypothetical protein [Duganella qianjiadongensis]MYM40934.1 hypothetical protein [Duganella qianjiadongensis]
MMATSPFDTQKVVGRLDVATEFSLVVNALEKLDARIEKLDAKLDVKLSEFRRDFICWVLVVWISFGLLQTSLILLLLKLLH